MDYTDIVSTAAEAIYEFGQAVLVRRVVSVYDPTAGTSTDTTTDYAADAVENSVNAMTAYAASISPGSLISEADRFFTVACDTAPLVNDKLVVGGVALAIQGVRPLSPGGTAIYFDVRARG